MHWLYGDVSALTLRFLFIGVFAILSMGIVATVLAFRWLKQKATGGSWQVASDAPAQMPSHDMPNDVARLDDVAVMGLPVQQRGRHLRVVAHAGPLDEVRGGRDHHAGVFVQPKAPGEPIEAMF